MAEKRSYKERIEAILEALQSARGSVFKVSLSKVVTG